MQNCFLVKWSLLILVLLVEFGSSEAQPQKNNTMTNKKQFEGFLLYHQFPTKLILNEIIRVQGQITDPLIIEKSLTQGYIVVMDFEKVGDGLTKFRCNDPNIFYKKQFDFSCSIVKQGQFTIVISAYNYQSNSNQFYYSSTRKRTIKPLSVDFSKMVSSQLPPSTQGFKLFLENNYFLLTWTSKAPLTNITFYQMIKQTNQRIKKEFLLSNSHQMFTPNFFEFGQFYPIETYVEISHALSNDGYLSQISSAFSKQKFSFPVFKSALNIKNLNNQDYYTSISAFPTKLKINEKINFTINFNINAFNFYYLLNVESQDLKKITYYHKGDESQIKNGTSVNIPLSFSKPGTYIFQLRSSSRSDILFFPIYVSEDIPIFAILPSISNYEQYFYHNGLEDSQKVIHQYLIRYLNNSKIENDPGFNSTLQKQRSFLFKLLNNQRQKRGFPLTLDDTLNKMAQQHSQDLSMNKFFDNLNKKVTEFVNRGAKYKIRTLLRSSVMQCESLTKCYLQAHIRPAFAETKQNKMFTKVGIGIAITNIANDSSMFLITYGYTTDQLTFNPKNPKDIQKLQNFQQMIIKTILQSNKNTLKQNIKISNMIKQWVGQNKQKQAQNLQNYLINKKYDGDRISVYTKQIYFHEEELQNIRDDQRLNNQQGQFGLGLAVDPESKPTLTVFVVFML